MRDIHITVMSDEERYSNRQIEKLLDDQSKELKEHMDLVTRPILEQTMKTNGRVTKLEGETSSIRSREAWFKGGLAAVLVILPIFFAILAWALLQIVDLKTSQPQLIQEATTAAVNQAFQENLKIDSK